MTAAERVAHWIACYPLLLKLKREFEKQAKPKRSPSMSDDKQLKARIEVRCSPEFYDALKDAAKRLQISLSDYARLAVAERMKIDARSEAHV